MSKVLSSIIVLTVSGVLWSTGCATGDSNGGTHTQRGSTDASADAQHDAGGSCDIMYCPNDGMGQRCCVTANGPCGYDMGGGCVAPSATGDPDGG